MTNYANNPDVTQEQGTTFIEMQQDYSPGYNVIVEGASPQVGTRLNNTTKVDAATGSANLLQFAIDDPTVVQQVYDANIKAWEASYPGATFDPKKDGVKLRDAVNLYMYLHYESSIESNYKLDADTGYMTTELPDSLARTGLKLESERSVPYTLTSEYTVGPNGEILDAYTGAIHNPVYVDRDGRPMSYNNLPTDEGTTHELLIFSQMLRLLWQLKKVPQELMSLFVDGKVKPVDQFTDEEKTTLRESEIFTQGYELASRVYYAHNLSGNTIIGHKVMGTPLADILSDEQIAMTEYQSTHSQPKSFYDWGGPYATGRNTF